MNINDPEYQPQLEAILQTLTDKVLAQELELSLMREAATRANSLSNVRVPADYVPAQSDALTGFIL